jgi:hypothetical protein
MYGEYVEVDGRRVFVLCNPDTSKAELERRAREQITREQEQCEQDDGHVYEMVGPPPWSCTFCGYKPDDGQRPKSKCSAARCWTSSTSASASLLRLMRRKPRRAA